MDIIVTYDIADTAGSGAERLRAVAIVCEAFGVRSQFSVFECRVSETGLERLKSDLLDVIDRTRDSVHIYRLSGSVDGCRTSLGRVKHHSVEQPWIL